MFVTFLRLGLAAAVVLGLADYAIREVIIKPRAQETFYEYLSKQPAIALSGQQKHFSIADAGNALYAVCNTSNTCFDWNDYKNVDIVVAATPIGGPKSPVRLLRQCDIDRCEKTNYPDVVYRAVNAAESSVLSTLAQSKHCTDFSIAEVYAARICTELQTLDGQDIYEIDYLLLEGQLLLRPVAERFSTASHLSADLVTNRRSYTDDIPISIRGL